MTDKTKSLLRLCYHVAVTAALAVAGVLLMVACVGIYRLNPDGHPFTREVVAQHFAPIALPVYLCAALAVLGFFLRPLLPAAPTPKADLTIPTLKRLTARVNLTACPAELAAAIQKERRARALHRNIVEALLAAGGAIFLLYALDMANFHISEITASMKAAMVWLIPCMGVPFAYGVFSAYFSRTSVKREIALLKSAPAEAVSPAPAPLSQSERWIVIVRCALIALALFFMAVGFAKGGWLDVLTKAINICTECIGLG